MKEVVPLIPLSPSMPLVDLPFLEREREPPLPVRTHEFLSRVFPPGEEVLVQRNDGRCNWIAVQIVQYGKQGSGKTEFARWLLGQAVEKYGKDSVEGWISRGDLKALLRPAYRKPVVILYDDDATLEKLDNTTVQALTRIRHICQERTGLDTGLVVVVIGLHRFHASNPLMRTNMDVLVVRTPPANLYDRDVIRQYVGAPGLMALEEIECARRRDRSAYGMAVFANPYSTLKGIVVSQLSDAQFGEAGGEGEGEEGAVNPVGVKISAEGTDILQAFKAVAESLPEKEREICTFFYDMMVNDKSYGDEGKRTSYWRMVKNNSELIGIVFERAWGVLNSDYVHRGGKGEVDFIKNDGSEWVEVKYRGTQYTWKPRLEDLSGEAAELLKRGIKGRCVMVAFKPRHNQHSRNALFVKEFPFTPRNNPTPSSSLFSTPSSPSFSTPSSSSPSPSAPSPSPSPPSRSSPLAPAGGREA